MGKTLRVFIVLLLVLSVVALSLGVSLFRKREIRKLRTQKMEGYLGDLAKTIEMEKESAEMMAVDTEQIKDLARMDESLRELVGKAQIQYDRLVQTRKDVVKIRDELRLVKLDLEETKNQLASARARVQELDGVVGAQKETIAGQNTRISDLELKESELDAEIEDLEMRIAKREEEFEEVRDQNEQLQNELDRVYYAKEKIEGVRVSRGLKGRILAVNQAWSFVVIGVDEGADIAHSLQCVVQRNEQLVGKVRISSTKARSKFAVAEIMPDWQQLPIKEGDDVVYYD